MDISSQATSSTLHPIVREIAREVRDRQLGEGSGHDWTHTLRVWNLADAIAEGEKADSFVVALAALLHDVGDYKLFDGDEEAGLAVVRSMLTAHNVDPDIVENVITIVSEISFHGGGTPRPMSTIEGNVVQDADRLDAIGAIGIARCFAYGGSRGRLIYDPDYTPQTEMSEAEYKAGQGDSISHFYEKLLLLRDLMNTQTGRAIADKRHQIMTRFLADFAEEWEQAYGRIDVS